MDKKPCWEVRQCNYGPGTEDPCVIVNHSLSDGFLEGENGSRSCFYIKGTVCFDNDHEMTVPEKLSTYCFDCEFYKKVVSVEGPNANIFFYLKFLHNKLLNEDRLHELPVIQSLLIS